MLVAVAAMLLPQLGLAPLVRAEIYFLDAARGMFESGDWLVPRYEGQPFFDKPILSYWLMVVAMEWFGPTAAAARLVPVLSALGLLGATAWLGALLLDRRTALGGTLVLATTIGFLSFARVAMSDMTLALLSTLAVALAVYAYRPGASALAVPLLGAVAGLGFATKGPIAVLVPGVAVLLLLIQKRRLPAAGGLAGIVAGVVAFAVLGFGWFALVYQRLGAEPLAYFFLRENLQRFAAATYDVGRPVWFYVPAYLAQGLPWSPFLPLAVARLVSTADAEARASARLLALWPLIVLVPLSLSRGKIDYYLLPLYPAVSLLLGRYVTATPWGRLDRTWARVVLVAGAAALALLLARPPEVPAEWLPGPFGVRVLTVLVGVGILGLLASAFMARAAYVLAALAAVVASVWLCLVTQFLPAFAANQPNRRIVEDVAREQLYRADLRVGYCSDPTQARRDILLEVRLVPEHECLLWRLMAAQVPYLLLVTKAEDASLRSSPRYRHIGTYHYLPAEALTFAGLFSLRAGEIRLGANFPTDDPVAEVKFKREYRKMLDREAGLTP